MSFFVSDRAMDISRVALEPEDTYLLYWIASLVPLYDEGGVAAAFFDANRWVSVRLPSAVRQREKRMLRGPGAPDRIVLAVMRLFERPAKRKQLAWLPDRVAQVANLDSRVILCDHMLKFHVNDRRDGFQRMFRERLERSATRV